MEEANLKNKHKPKKLDESESHQQDQHVTCLIVGDTFCGKTNLLYSYARDEFIQEYTPTVCDHYALGEITRTTSSGTKKQKLSGWDRSGKPEHAQLRKFAY